MGKPNKSDFGFMAADARDGWAILVDLTAHAPTVFGFFPRRDIAEAMVEGTAETRGFEALVVPSLAVDGQIVAARNETITTHAQLRARLAQYRGAVKVFERSSKGGRRG